jgi:hypothetical protein
MCVVCALTGWRDCGLEGLIIARHDGEEQAVERVRQARGHRAALVDELSFAA